jgi:(1->4)-alpha-D-glucan 1-alpha-D-glucosylmutase
MNIPSSTYRIQFHKGFTFKDLRNIIGYLCDLGISTIYAAPILKSRENSMHGYDVVDPHEIDAEIGTLEELKEIAHELKKRGMTWLQDIVPNHMAYDSANWRLMDVFERGEHSPYYNYFDINWRHPAADLSGKVMVPFLGKELNQCIEDDEIKLSCNSTGYFINYYDTSYPLSVSAYKVIPELPDVGSLIDLAKTQSEVDKWTSAKASWFRQNSKPEARERICDAINSNKSLLRKILDTQYYTLTYWKRSEHEINYRRFFTVNELICLRMEDKKVFDEYHTLIKKLYDDSLIQGVRIDHIDGLQDPAGYVTRLRNLLGPDCYIIAEKILESKENIPADWPIEGTSGYEFLSLVSQLMTDRQGARKLVEFYRELVPELPPYQKLVVENKKRILQHHMHGEWENLVSDFENLKLTNGFTKESIKNALAAVMISLPVYRIYPEQLPLDGIEKQVMTEAFQKATERDQENLEEVKYLQKLLVEGGENDKDQILKFEKRFMQFTGPLTAKGVEDTTFYVYNPLISHDEVGDAPSTLGISISSFQSKMVRRMKSNPLSLNATATHDTKRGEDSRMRLNVLSEVPDVWMRQVREWFETNKQHKKNGEIEVPSVNDEYFIYQSLIGGYPHDFNINEEFTERFNTFLIKAIREAKQYSNWSEPNEEYEKASLDFISALLNEENSFKQNFSSFMEVINKYSHLYCIIQVLIKITAPGIPDIYQGCELWDLSFVDPDNRRPVNFDIRKRILTDIKQKEREGPAALLGYLKTNRSEGFEKLYVTWKSLNLRKQYDDLFEKGEYIPLQSTGKTELVLAYSRQLKDNWVVVVVPLGIAKNMQVDQPYAEGPDDKKYVILPQDAPKKWKNVFTQDEIMADGKLYLFEIFKDFPAALLVNQ